MPRKIDEKKRQLAISLLQEGMSIKAVSEKSKISQPSVSKIKGEIGLVKKRGGPKTAPRKTSDDGMETAIFALKIGGIKKALDALKRVNEDEVVSFCIESGGTGRALERIQELEASMKF